MTKTNEQITLKTETLHVTLGDGTVRVHKVPVDEFEEIKKISSHYDMSLDGTTEWCIYGGITFFKENEK